MLLVYAYGIAIGVLTYYYFTERARTKACLLRS
jgi:hypothetical protein